MPIAFMITLKFFMTIYEGKIGSKEDSSKFTNYALQNQCKDPDPSIEMSKKSIKDQMKVVQLLIGHSESKKSNLKSDLTSYDKI